MENSTMLGSIPKSNVSSNLSSASSFPMYSTRFIIHLHCIVTHGWPNFFLLDLGSTFCVVLFIVASAYQTPSQEISVENTKNRSAYPSLDSTWSMDALKFPNRFFVREELSVSFEFSIIFIA